MNIKEVVDEHEIQDIISFRMVSGILRPFSYVSFIKNVQELQTDSLGGPADLRGVKAFYQKTGFSVDGNSVLRRPD